VDRRGVPAADAERIVGHGFTLLSASASMARNGFIPSISVEREIAIRNASDSSAVNRRD
jgi:hypothetical protein